MTSTLTQVSNVFNLLCLADARLLNYHFGWQWDINKEIDNNFDPGNKTGRLFPAVQMDVPDYFQALEQPSYDGTKEEIKVLLYFYDEQDYNNDSSAKTINLIEQWTNLKTIAEDFMANYLEVIGPKKYNVGFISNPRYTQRSNLHNDRLIVWEVEFTLTHIAPCTNILNKINLNLLPDILQLQDLERITEPPPPCFSLASDGVNEDILVPPNAAFNFEWTQPFSIEAWIYPSTNGAINFALSKFDLAIPKGWFVMVLGSSGSPLSGALRMQLRNQFPGVYIDCYSNQSIIFGQWNHVVFTSDSSGTIGGIDFYIDAVATTKPHVTGPGTAGPLVGGTIINTEDVTINSLPDTGNYSENNLFLTRMWNTQLNAGEVLSLYNGLTVPKSANLIINADLDSSVWNGLEFDIPDLTGVTTGYTTRNAEEEDKVEDCP